MGKPCSIPECERPHEGLGYCRLHRRRFLKHGDPNTVLPPKPYAGRDEDAAKDVLLSRRRVTNAGCWEYTGAIAVQGYGRMGYRGQTMGVHRLAYEWFVTPVPDGLFVCHQCDNRRCFNPAHLFLGTAADNNADMDAKGRARRVGFTRRATSEECASKLIIDDVLAIRQSIEPVTVLAARYGVSKPHIYNIRNGKKWRHPTEGDDSG